MADLKHYQLIDGTKSIPLNALPPEAWTIWGGDNEHSDRAELVASVAFLYRCIDVRAAALAGVPWSVVRGESEVWNSEEPQPPTGTQYEWLADVPALLPRIEEALSIGSEAFAERLQTRGGQTLGLKWLTPSSMTPKWDESAGLVGFERTLGKGRKLMMAVEDVLYIWLQGMHETKPKTSPVQAAMQAAGVLDSAGKFATQFFERGAIKASILAVPATTQRRDKEELESWFQRAMTGLSKAWSSKAINADAVEVIPVGEGLESLSNAVLTTSMREDIATAMGVPHSMVLSNAANYATAEADRLNLYDTTIIPQCTIIEQALNEQLFEPVGLRFQFKPQELSLYQEDEEQRASAFEAYVRAGMPISVVVQMLGINLPDGVTPESLDELNEPEPVPEQLQPFQGGQQPPQLPQNAQNGPESQERDAEVRRFRKWAARRIQSKSFDPAAFESDVLTDADKAAIVAELTEDGDAADAPFPVVGWDAYP